MQEIQKIVKLENEELVYGNAEEVTTYCKQNDTNIKTEYNHVTPSIVSKNFKYIGNCIQKPYAISKNMNYKIGDFPQYNKKSKKQKNFP
jgi:hypothetical protein